MTYSYIKILLIFLLLGIVFTSCSGSPKTVVLVQPESEGYELPLEIWSTMNLKKLSMKLNSCVLDEKGNPVEIGTKAIVLEKAKCEEVIYKTKPPMTFPMGMVKIRVIDTGEEGWTWSGAVNSNGD